MKTCLNCEESFNPDADERAYDSAMDDYDDPDDYNSALCLDCNLPAEVASHMALGSHILNHLEDHEDDPW